MNSTDNLLHVAAQECDRIRLGLMSGSIPVHEAHDLLLELSKRLHDAQGHVHIPSARLFGEEELYG